MRPFGQMKANSRCHFFRIVRCLHKINCYLCQVCLCPLHISAWMSCIHASKKLHIIAAFNSKENIHKHKYTHTHREWERHRPDHLRYSFMSYNHKFFGWHVKYSGTEEVDGILCFHFSSLFFSYNIIQLDFWPASRKAFAFHKTPTPV